VTPDCARKNYAPHDCEHEEYYVKDDTYDDDQDLHNGANDVHDRLPRNAKDCLYPAPAEPAVTIFSAMAVRILPAFSNTVKEFGN